MGPAIRWGWFVLLDCVFGLNPDRIIKYCGVQNGLLLPIFFLFGNCHPSLRAFRLKQWHPTVLSPNSVFAVVLIPLLPIVRPKSDDIAADTNESDDNQKFSHDLCRVVGVELPESLSESAYFGN